MSYAEKRGTKFRARYRDADGLLRSGPTFDRKEEAEEVAASLEAKAKGQVSSSGDLDPMLVTLQGWADYHFPRHRVSIITRVNYAAVFRLHIAPCLGQKRLRSITTGDVLDWWDTLGKTGLGIPTQRRARVVLGILFNAAVNARHITTSPMPTLKTEKAKPKKIHIMSVQTFDSLLDHLPTEAAQLLVEVDIESGLRFGEITALRPCDFIFRHRGEMARLLVRRAVSDVGTQNSTDGKRFEVHDWTKNGTTRELTLSAEVSIRVEKYIAEKGLGEDDLLFHVKQVLPTSAEIAREWLTDEVIATLGTYTHPVTGREYQHGTPTCYTMGCHCRWCRKATSDAAAMRRALKSENRAKHVPRKEQEPFLPRDAWRRTFISAAKAAGIKHVPHMHELRHTHASWLIEAGIDALTVMDRLGHADLTTTRLYVHEGEEDTRAADAMSAIRGRRRSA